MNPYAAYVFELNKPRDTAHAIVVLYNVYRGPVPGTRYLAGTHEQNGTPNRQFADSRLPIFFDYTLRSLANQASDNFFVVFMYERRTRFRVSSPEEILRKAESEIDVPFALAPIPPIDFSTDYRRAFWRRRDSEEAAIRRFAGDRKRLLVTYLDGDDLLHTDYVEAVQGAMPPGLQCLGIPGGFMYSSTTDRIRKWDRRAPRMPPFFTLQYEASAFLRGQRLYGGPGRHLYVNDHLRSSVLARRLFAQHVHGRNDSTAYAMPHLHPDLTGKKRAEVLRSLGILRPTFVGRQSARHPTPSPSTASP